MTTYQAIRAAILDSIHNALCADPTLGMAQNPGGYLRGVVARSGGLRPDVAVRMYAGNLAHGLSFEPRRYREWPVI